MKKRVKNSVYALFIASGLCLTGCGRNNNTNEGAADPVERNENMSNDTINSSDAGFVNDTISE